MSHSQNYTPKHHIAVASEFLDAIGDKTKVLQRTSHASSDQVLALAAQAHIAMAAFKAQVTPDVWRSDFLSEPCG